MSNTKIISFQDIKRLVLCLKSKKVEDVMRDPHLAGIIYDCKNNAFFIEYSGSVVSREFYEDIANTLNSVLPEPIAGPYNEETLQGFLTIWAYKFINIQRIDFLKWKTEEEFKIIKMSNEDLIEYTLKMQRPDDYDGCSTERRAFSRENATNELKNRLTKLGFYKALEEKDSITYPGDKCRKVFSPIPQPPASRFLKEGDEPPKPKSL